MAFIAVGAKHHAVVDDELLEMVYAKMAARGIVREYVGEL